MSLLSLGVHSCRNLLSTYICLTFFLYSPPKLEQAMSSMEKGTPPQSLSSILKVLLRFIWGLVRFEAVLIHVLFSTHFLLAGNLPPSLKLYLFLLFQMYVPISLATANSSLLIMLTKELKFYQISISFFHASIMSPKRDEFWYCLSSSKD